MFTKTLTIGLALAGLSQAACPYAEQARIDPQLIKAPLEHQNTAEDDAIKAKRQSGPGGIPFTTFNKNQRIDVSGEHTWKAPGFNDLRGPCPGLNALANHGYFPRVCHLRSTP